MKRRVALCAVLASSALALTACSSSTASPPEEEEATSELTETCEAGTNRGSVLEDELVQMPDGRVFCSVKLNPDDELTSPHAVENYAVDMHGLTAEHVAEAKVRGADFLIETFFDNPNAGTPESVGTEYIEANADLYGAESAESLISESTRMLENARGEEVILANDFFTLAGSALPPLKDDDGGSRIESMALKPVRYSIFTETEEVVDDPTKVRLQIGWEAEVTYRIQPALYEEWRTGEGSKIYEEKGDEPPTDFSGVDLSGDSPAFLTVHAGDEEEHQLNTTITFAELLAGEADTARMLFNLTLDAKDLAHN